MEDSEFKEYELEIIRDTNFLKTKGEIIAKIMRVFGQLRDTIKTSKIHQGFPYAPGIDTLKGKISKGENYKSLPYVVMDFPKHFDKRNIFTFRSMFWWGHEFSFTLHLAGSYLDLYSEQLQHIDRVNSPEDTYFGISNDAWQYDYGPENYQTVAGSTASRIEEQLERHAFIKISRRLSLDGWRDVPAFGCQTLEDFLGLLQ